MINRFQEYNIASHETNGKAVAIMGPRQAGKTSFLNRIPGDVLWLDGNESADREFLRTANPASFSARIGDHKCVIIDKAHRIENIWNALNLLIKDHPDVQFYTIGNPSIELDDTGNQQQNKPLKIVLLPLSFEEMCNHHGIEMELQLLEHRLIYGYYPDVVMNPGKETEILKQLTQNFLYTDILMWERIQKPERFEQLLLALALQVGQMVSYHDLGKRAGLANETIEKYIQLLEREFVVFTLNSFSRNLNNELSKSKKVYFYDNGLRNAILNQFSPLSLRNDVSALWENFVMVERKKFLNNYNLSPNCYFWRTKDQAEINYLEEVDGKITACAFQFSEGAKPRFSKSFVETYHPFETKPIHRGNFQDWITTIPANQQPPSINYNRPQESRNQDYSMELD
jgi:uncharacterized protein